ncbi:MAG: lysylphosphatidylglycerol synthase transmembrane domain-containing protein [Methanoregulaceae archaeon]
MYRKISAIAISTLIAAGIIVYMLARVWDNLLMAFQHVSLDFLVCAVITCLIAWGLRGLRYQIILKNLEISVSTLYSTACIFVSQTANLIVPARLGDLVRIFLLKEQKNATYSEGISSLVVERVFDIATVALLGLLSLVFVLNVPLWVTELILIPLILALIFFGFLLFIRKSSSENKYIRIILTMLEEIRRASLTVRALIILGVSSFIIWILDTLVCMFIAMMFQVSIPFAVIALGIVIGNLVKAVPITPGGIGTYEASVAFTFSLAGVSPISATLIAIIDHLVKNLITLIGGAISIYYFGDCAFASVKNAISAKFSGKNNDSSR